MHPYGLIKIRSRHFSGGIPLGYCAMACIRTAHLSIQVYIIIASSMLSIIGYMRMHTKQYVLQTVKHNCYGDIGMCTVESYNATKLACYH
jgi:hypothetical protein